MLDKLQAIILAGGLSERFQTGNSKLLEKICGTEMILYPIHLLQTLQIPTSIVLGFQSDKIKNVILSSKINVNFIEKGMPLGTGHAVQISQPLWSHDNILMMNADIPLLTPDVINKLYRKHIKHDADISFATAHLDIPETDHCRVVIQNEQIRVVEKDMNSDIDASTHCCVSAGIYIAKRSFLEKYINKLTLNPVSGELYLPELVQIASDNNCKVITTQIPFDVIRSIETLADLWAIEHIKRSHLIQHMMNNGVRFANTLNIQIDNSISVAPGCYIGSGVLLLGSTTIKQGASIGAYSQLENCTIQENVVIPPFTYISNTTITRTMTLEPFTKYTQKDLPQNTVIVATRIKEEQLQ